jgi:class 3 adenylate cyclase
MRADPRTEAEVARVLSQIVEGVASGDVDAGVSMFADDPDVFLQGTGVDEARTGRAAIREQIERDFTQADALSWTMLPQSISSAGSVAWTAGNVLIRVTMGGKTLEIPHRLTTVLERRGGEWLLVQMHLSVANVAQAAGQSYPTNLDAVTEAVGLEQVDLRSRLAPDGTVTLMFTDIEGSTPLAEQLGDLRWLALLREHNAIVRDQIAHHGGFEVKTIGDAFMIAFGSARRAVSCAIGIQREVARFAADRPEHPVRVRIGLHTGEPLREGNDFHGKSVIFASRITGKASGGEILVSALLRELTESGGDIRFDAGREVVLKGIAGTHRVYPVCLA